MSKLNTDEVWRAIPGYDGFYEISNQGFVRSLNRHILYPDGSLRLRKQKYLIPQKDANGYTIFRLSKNGITSTKTAHRLVAETFLPNPNNLPMVLHGVNDKSNNCLENLRWGTNSENLYDSVKDNTHTNSSKTVGDCGHELNKFNTVYRKNKNQRECRACKSGRDWVQRYPILKPYHKEISDIKYKQFSINEKFISKKLLFKMLGIED